MSQEKTEEMKIAAIIENPDYRVTHYCNHEDALGTIVKAFRNKANKHGTSYIFESLNEQDKPLCSRDGVEILILENVTFEIDQEKRDGNLYRDENNDCVFYIGSFTGRDYYGVGNTTPYNFYGNEMWASERYYMKDRADFKEVGLNSRGQMTARDNGREVVSAERVIMCATGVWATGIKYAEPYEWEIELGLQ